MKDGVTEPVRAVRRVERNLSQLQRERTSQNVHHFRTSVRRLEAVLELAGDGGLPPKLAKAMRKIWRRTGNVRDCEVQLGLLRDLHLGPELPAKRGLQQWLEERRGRRQHKLEQALEREAARELRLRLQRLRREWEGRPPGLPASPAAEALRGYCEAARASEALEPAGLHALRKRAKHLRYMAEVERRSPGARGEAGEMARAVESGLRRLQAALGAWHDWAELSDAAAAHGGAGAAALQAALRNLTGAKLQQALRERAAVDEELARCASARRRPPASALRGEPRRAATA